MYDKEVVLTTHFWGYKYPTEYVRRLHRSLAAFMGQPFRFIVVTDNPNQFPTLETTKIIDPELTEIKGCTVRLRMWDPNWQRAHGIDPGTKIVSLDLDVIVTGMLDPLFKRDDDFVILQGVNVANPCPYNGSIFMFKAGTHPEVWHRYSPRANLQVPFYEFPDDQGWLHYMYGEGAGAWGVKDGVYAYQKRGWPKGTDLPGNARLVTFPGSKDPSKVTNLAWVKHYWGGLDGIND